MLKALDAEEEESDENEDLNMERAYKREGHTPFELFVGFLTDQFKLRMLS